MEMESNVNTSRMMGAVLALGFVVSGVAWALMPSLQRPGDAVDQAAAFHVERGRRLLAQFDPGLVLQNLLLDRLLDDGVEAAGVDELTDDGMARYEDVHSAWWKMFRPTDWGDSPHSPPPNYGNLDSQARQGVRGRNDIFRHNGEVLRAAMADADAALSISIGDRDGRSHAEANRLKGIVAYYESLAHRLSARRIRMEAALVMAQLVALSERTRKGQGAVNRVEDSGIQLRIDELNQKAAELELANRDQRSALAGLDETIRNLRERVQRAESKREEATHELRRLTEAGADISDPNGLDAFRLAVQQQDRSFREAARMRQSLEAGSLPRARIDWTGDYLSGQYVENGSPQHRTIEFGLLHHEKKRALSAAHVAAQEQELDALRLDIAHLVDVKRRYAADADAARRAIEEARSEAADLFDDWMVLDEQAVAAEDSAITRLKESAGALRQASGYAGAWVNEARDRSQGLSTAAQQYSALYKRTQDGWIGGFILAESADPRLAMAWVYYEQFLAYSRAARSLGTESVRSLVLDVSIDELMDQAAAARENGVDAITTMASDIQRSHRDAGRHWTLVAQAAGATYLLVLFGDESYRNDAIEGYRKALQGREDAPYATRIAARLQRLEDHQ